jgi:hypothetical protein
MTRILTFQRPDCKEILGMKCSWAMSKNELETEKKSKDEAEFTLTSTYINNLYNSLIVKSKLEHQEDCSKKIEKSTK